MSDHEHRFVRACEDCGALWGDEEGNELISNREKIKQALAALSWDQPWIPGKHYVIQTYERINKAIQILKRF